jgi:hypothetical protein
LGDEFGAVFWAPEPDDWMVFPSATWVVAHWRNSLGETDFTLNSMSVW